MVEELQPAEKLLLQPFPIEHGSMSGQNMMTDGVLRKGKETKESKLTYTVYM